MNLTVASSVTKKNKRAIFKDFKAKMGDAKISKDKEDKDEKEDKDSFSDEYKKITEKMKKISNNIFLEQDTSMLFNDVDIYNKSDYSMQHESSVARNKKYIGLKKQKHSIPQVINNDNLSQDLEPYLQSSDKNETHLNSVGQINQYLSLD